MRAHTGGVSLPVNGETVSVPGVSHLRFPTCGERLFGLSEAREMERRAIELYRAKYGLLSADQIREIRQQHALTQAELARLLRLGANTISRWEAGRNVQTAAMDVLLRLIRDLPGSVEYLREHAALASTPIFGSSKSWRRLALGAEPGSRNGRGPAQAPGGPGVRWDLRVHAGVGPLSRGEVSSSRVGLSGVSFRQVGILGYASSARMG